MNSAWLIIKRSGVGLRSGGGACRRIHGSCVTGKAQNPNLVGPKPSLDFKFFRENEQLFVDEVRNRNIHLVAPEGVEGNENVVRWIIEKSKELEKLRMALIECRQMRNQLGEKSKQLGKQRSGGDGNEDEFKRLTEESRQVRQNMADLSKKISSFEDSLIRIARHLPNVTHHNVPIGNEDNATLLDMKGVKKTSEECGFKLKSYLDIGKSLNLFDFEAASRVSGPKFFYLKNDGMYLSMCRD